MSNTWTTTFRRLAAGMVIGSATAFASAMCYAQSAYDDASDIAYLDGWQDGDNGGFGFGPWNFDGTYDTPPPDQQAIDNGLNLGGTGSSPYNDIGRAWTIYNPLGRPVAPSNGAIGTDIARIGRGFSPLKVGQTLSFVVDNPIQQSFFRGYIIRLISGGANSCLSGDNCSTMAYDPGSITTRLYLGTFEYNTYGRWHAGTDADILTEGTTLVDVDTDAGMRVDVRLTGADTYHLTMTPLDNPGAAYSESGTLAGSGPIDWFSIDFFNTDSDFYPTSVSGPQSTDFYIRSMTIVPEPGVVSMMVLGSGTLLGVARRRRAG